MFEDDSFKQVVTFYPSLMKLLKYIPYFFSIIFFLNGNAQQPVYKKFNTINGLPSNFVYKVFQDSKGMIWFATNTGVSRYDGVELEVCGTQDYIPCIDIWYMYEDSYGRIWFLTFSDNFYYFSYQDEKFHTIKNPHDKGLSLPTTSLNETPRGTIITNCFNISSNGELENFYYEIRPDLSVIKNYINIPDNKFQVALNNRHFIEENIYFEKGGFCLIDSLHPFSDHLISVTNGRLFCFYNEMKKEIVLETKHHTINKQISELVGSKNQLIWINILNDTTLCFRFENEMIITDLNLKIDSRYDFIRNEHLRNVTIDNQNNVWAVTRYEGVFLYSSTEIAKIWLGKDYFLNSIEVRHIEILNPKELFVATTDGCLYRARLEKGGKWKTKLIFKSNGFIRDMSLTWDKSKLIFILSLDYWNIGVLDLKTGIKEIRYFSNLDKKYDKNNIKLYRPANFKSIQNRNDFTTINESGKVTVIDQKNPEKSFTVILKGRIMDACYDDKSELLWCCGPGGVVVYDAKRKILNNQFIFLPSTRITLDSKNRPWFSSGNQGLFLIENNAVHHIANTAGKINFELKNIETGQMGSATDKGLYKINESDLKADFLLNIGNSRIYTFNRLNDSTYLLGTEAGLKISNNLLQNYKFNCSPLLKNFKLGNLKFNENPDYVKADYNNNSLSAGVMIPCFNNLKYKVKYKLLGFDDNFSETVDHPVLYKKIPSGKYTLQILVIENSSGDTIGQKSVVVTIGKHWSETWLFRGLMVILFFGSLSMLLWYIYKSLERRNQIKLEMDQMIANQKLVALQHQLNPHFVFNVLNSIQSFIMKKDTMGANYYLNRFSRLMRHVLESSRHLYIPLKLEIDILKTYLELEKLRYGDKLNFEVIFDESLDITKEIPSMVIQPFVENAIKHGVKKIDNPGYINVIFNMKGNLLKVSVLDNGPGIYNHDEQIKNDLITLYKSRGLQITKERLDAFSELGYCKLSFSLEENNGELPFDKGTCVNIFIEYL